MSYVSFFVDEIIASEVFAIKIMSGLCDVQFGIRMLGLDCAQLFIHALSLWFVLHCAIALGEELLH